jgi:hypothetical protein
VRGEAVGSAGWILPPFQIASALGLSVSGLRKPIRLVASPPRWCTSRAPCAVERAFHLRTNSVRLSGAGQQPKARGPERESTLPDRINSETREQAAKLGVGSESSPSWISCSKSGAAPCEGSRVGLSLAEEPLDPQDLQQPLEQHHLPREVFFFGLAFAGGFAPAAAARAFCFFVANLSPSARWVQSDRCYSLFPRSSVRRVRLVLDSQGRAGVYWETQAPHDVRARAHSRTRGPVTTRR